MATTSRPLKLGRRSFFADCGYEPHPGQWQIHRSKAPRRVVACGVRWGKSLAAAMEALAAAMEPKERSIGWCVGPTYDLADKIFREVQIIALRHLQHRIVSLRDSDRRILLRNLAGGISEIRAKSADNPVSLLGEGLDWLIIDEAARLKPAVWQNHLSQRLIDKMGWALMISTPRGKGWFFELFRRGQGNDPDYESWNNPSWSNPHLDAEVIEAERGRLPQRVFDQEYGGAFLEGAGQVFRFVRDRATGDWQDPKPGEMYFGGLDLAKIEDHTVLVIMNNDAEVVFADRFHKLDWSIQVARVKAAADRYNEATILVDTTGVGEPVYESLCEAGLCVDPYQLTNRSKNAIIDNLALVLEKGEITLPRPDLWPEGIDELEAFEYSVTDFGNVRSGAPGGMHDDCVIALALAAWQVRKSDPGTIIWI